ncbi:hypothetical protein N665_0251s0050 [Sinapis alba]|nr:hypothetical protein N665_0251s0050 [Sinapis alba]
MDQLRGYKANCRFSLGRPRFGSIKFKVPNSSQPFVSEERKEIEEEAESIGFREDEEVDDDELEGDEEEEEKKKHICCECGKRFKSGKALGGHKRIHVVETRKFSMVRPKMVSGAVGRSERYHFEVDCCICHKKFTSLKALYGHMRFHPDRGWKGVLPPHHLLGHDHHDGEFVSSDYDDEDDYDYEDDDENLELWDNHWELENVVDLKDSIEGWAVTGKRGRKSALKDPPTEAIKDDIDAKDLLFLATTAESVDLDVGEACEEMMKKRKKKKKRLSEMEKESSSNHDHHQLDEVGDAAAEEGGGGAREKHVCVTCNKSFASYQALGGHRASHNKVKISENHQARANSEALLLGTEAMITGQALGGHKRCHWPGPVSNEAATAPGPASNESAPAAPTAPVAASFSQVTESVQEVKKLKRKFLEFDLNELPPNED